MKLRSSRNYNTQYASVNQGYDIGIEQAVFVKTESVGGTAQPPVPGTQGSSISDATPSTDISGGTDTSIQIAVDGNTAVTASVVVTGLNTGVLIAAAFETAINNALSAAGIDAAVWVEFTSSLYTIHSQRIGTDSSVVVTAAALNDVAADLKLGVANSGVEAAGTNGTDFFLMTKASHKYTQPRTISNHRTGRLPSSTIKAKKMVEGDIETYINIDTSLMNPAVDAPLVALLKQVLASYSSSASEVRFNMSQAPTAYNTLYETTNITGSLLNGIYAKSFEISLPGDSPAQYKMTFKGRDVKSCTISQLNGIVSASTSVVLNAGEGSNVEAGALVMCIGVDGRTCTAGGDGLLYVVSTNTSTHTVVLSAAVTCADDSYLVPFDPAVFGGLGGTDAPAVGLVGSVSFDNGSTTFDTRSVMIKIDDKKSDIDNYYGSDSNKGYIVGSRAEINVSVEINLSAVQYKKLMQIKADSTYALKVVLGDPAGRRLEVLLPKVQFNQPSVDIPDSGPVPVTFEGFALDSANGALDAITLSYK